MTSVRCYCNGEDGDGRKMRLVSSVPSGFDMIKVYECEWCRRGLTVQEMPTVGGAPVVVRSVWPIGLDR